MSDTVIRVEQLGKKYSISLDKQDRRHYATLRDVMVNGVRGLFAGRIDSSKISSRRKEKREFWALEDVSFEVKKGDRVGIIGRNGAGKSTLLKILSRITEPTEGRISINGRVASLLEVGTGFHQELTGRENIYLNGAILGMSKTEIRRNFDEIVAFAEVEKFLDTPVKRYSSGMYVRLAFAVAAHLEPEILVVDEVLAVGDAQFQRKCLGKMESFGEEGRTVIFVSHQMSTIQALCNRGLVLQTGKVMLDGNTDDAVNLYLESGYELSNKTPLAQRKDRSGSAKIKVTDINILDENGMNVSSLLSGENYYFRISCLSKMESRISNIILSLDIFDERDNRILLFRTNFSNESFTMIPGINYVMCNVSNLPITLGSYKASILVSHADKEVLDYVKDAFSFSVEGGDFFGTGSSGLPTHCKILTKVDWSCSEGHRLQADSLSHA